MGKILKYEDSNFRTFKIELNATETNATETNGEAVFARKIIRPEQIIFQVCAGKIIRPKKHITKDDLLGAIVSFHEVAEMSSGSSIVFDNDIIIDSVSSMVTSSGTGPNNLAATANVFVGESFINIGITYSISNDTFAIVMKSDAEGVDPVTVTLENVFIDEFSREQVKLD